MDKLTPQEAAHYYGQDVAVFINGAYSKTWKVTGQALAQIAFDNEEYALEVVYRLLLRPLSDITEEELLEVAKIEGTANRQELANSGEDYERFTKNDTEARLYFWYESGGYDEPEHSTSAFTISFRNGDVYNYMGVCDNHHRITQYLLKKGFCIFPEWFESGKAIDKTKREEPA